MEEEQKVRETIIWLAGLLSTDGTVRDPNPRRGRGHTTLQYSIASHERGWLEKIVTKLSEIGILTRIVARESWDPLHKNKNMAYEIFLEHPYYVTQLLRKYGKDYMMERKWKRVISTYETAAYSHWTPWDDSFLIENYRKMLYRDIAKRLLRPSSRSITYRVAQLRKMGKLPRKESVPRDVTTGIFTGISEMQ